MIELPEAETLAREINETLAGKMIDTCIRGNSPHKFAFYTGTPADYARMLNGKTIGMARSRNSSIVISAEPGYAVVLGDGGERIQFHEDEKTIPKKHQLLLNFSDGTALSVTVSGWGACRALPEAEIAKHDCREIKAPSPLSPDFTLDCFLSLFGVLEENDKRSVKFFIISQPGIPGVGNGYLQDILFRAKIHPRRRAADLSLKEKKALHKAIVETIHEAVKLCGRTDERDLFGHAGGYRRILDSTQVGQPCPRCGTPIEKISYLGGACYLCPKCQS
jgi:formamidopyrimidine-DNA glycosylase